MSDQPEVQIGQLWQECDRRFVRQIRIVGVARSATGEEYAEIKSYVPGGEAPKRTTRAKLSRFNGRRGGYRYVSGPEGA